MRAFAFALFGVCVGLSEIPRSLREEAGNARTLEEFRKILRKHGPVEVRYSGDDLTINRTYIIGDPKAGTPTCQLRESCSPVNVVLHANQLMYPQCVNMRKCEGGCCYASNLCLPTDVKIYQVKVRIFTENEQGGFSEHVVYVNMPDALGCKCTEQLNCEPTPTLDDCKCISRFEAEKTCSGTGTTPVLSTFSTTTTSGTANILRHFIFHTFLLLCSLLTLLNC